MSGLPRLLGLAVAAVLLIGACSDPAPPKPAPRRGDIILPAGQGTLYLVAGPLFGRGDLFRLPAGRADPERLTRLAPGQEVTSVSAAGGEVVVNASPDGLGKVYRLAGKRLEPLTEERGFGPDLSDDGRLAYTSLTKASSDDQSISTRNVVVRDLKTGQERVVYQTSLPLSVVEWGPGGRLAVLVFTADYKANKAYLILGPDGSQREVQPVVPVANAFIWGRGGLLAVGVAGAAGALVDVDSGESEGLPAGWRPLCWSPDGSALLVSKGARLGLIRPSAASQVEQLGAFGRGKVWEAAWVG